MKNRNEDNVVFTIMQQFYKVFSNFCIKKVFILNKYFI
jgi:hypothetical protein